MNDCLVCRRDNARIICSNGCGFRVCSIECTKNKHICNQCSICGKNNPKIICDNSCGTAFCSDECSKKDTHECSDCPKCNGSVLKHNKLWKCNKCNYQTDKLEYESDEI